MTLEQIVKQSQGEQYVYPDVFTDKCGLDIILSNDKLHAVRSWGYTKGNPKRRATLEITTFRGISSNAVHYYGRIKIQGVNMECDGEPGHRISVKERLPEPNKIVLCRMVSNGAIVSGYIVVSSGRSPYVATDGGFEFEDWNDYECDMWMPIPSFDDILEANRDVLERIKQKGD